jgi:predicted phage terminase large subunit-like protein
MVNDLSTLNQELDEVLEHRLTVAARKSFYHFNKYIVGYNGKANRFIVPHVHGSICNVVQYSLKDIEDIAASRLSEPPGTIYDTFSRHCSPPPMGAYNSIPLNETPPPEPSVLKEMPRIIPDSDPRKEAKESQQRDAARRRAIANIEKNGTIKSPTDEPSTDGSLHDSMKDSSGQQSNIIIPSTKVDFSGYDFSGILPYNEIMKKILDLMPRGSLKSSCVTESLPLYAWLFNNTLRIHIASETLDKAGVYYGATQGHLENNKKYRDRYKHIWGVFPDEDREVWSRSELNITGSNRSTREKSLTIGSPAVPKVGQHFDIIIVDDPVGPTNISDVGLEETLNYYRGLLAVLEPGGVLILIGTRWHHRDVYGYILANEKNFTIIQHGAHNEDGSLFFPERLTEEFLAEQKASMKAAFYSAQYENKIVSDKDAAFKREYFRNERIDKEDWERMNRFMLIDPVPPDSNEKNDPDYFAIVIGGISATGDLYYLDGWRGRPSVGEAIEKIINMYNQWTPKKIGFESVGFQKVYSYNLRLAARERGLTLPIVEIKRSDRGETKNFRIERLQPYYEQGRVIHRLGAGFVDALEDELAEHPKSSHDDLKDAFADLVAIGWASADKRKKVDEDGDEIEGVKRRYQNKYTRY